MAKIKYILLFLSFFSVMFFFVNGCNVKNEAENNPKQKKTLNIDPGTSRIKWTILRNTGYISGTLKFVKGNILTDESGLPATGNITIDAESITIDNMQEPDVNNKALELIRSEKFLNTEKFKTIDVTIRTFVTLRYDPMPGKNGTVKGSITIKDSTAMYAMPVSVKYHDNEIECESINSFPGTNWGMHFSEFKPDPSYESNPLKENIEIDFYLKAK